MSAIAPALQPTSPLASTAASAASALAPAAAPLPHVASPLANETQVAQQTYVPPPQAPSPYEGPPTSILPTGQMLARNPQLPSKGGTGTDAQYAADEAMLREQIRQQYNDVLSNLGYKDDAGNLVMGTTELDAYRQQRDLSRQQGLAVRDVTNQMQQSGTLFSGYRGTAQGLAERPFISALADIGVDLPKALSRYYEQAQNLMTDYELQQSQLLMQAADRYAARLAASPTGGGAQTGGGGSATAPTTPTDPNESITPPGPEAPVLGVTSPMSTLGLGPEDIAALMQTYPNARIGPGGAVIS